MSQLVAHDAFTLTGFALILTSMAFAGGPPNDDCANAIAIGDGVFTGTTVGATNDAAGTCGSSSTSADVWYLYTAPQDGTLRLETCGSEYDTVMGLWSDCPGPGSELACNDDSCGLQSGLAWDVLGGEEYYVRVSGWNNASGSFTLSVETSDPGGGETGPDMTYSNITQISYWGEVDGIHAYSPDSYSCNIGDETVQWDATVQGYNAYKLSDGRLVQIGMSWVKEGFFALANPGCGLPCNGQGGSVLGPGCLDIYSAGLNGNQAVLGPRSVVNGFTGEYGGTSGEPGNAIFKRLQVHESDLTVGDALYFFEGMFVAPDDAAAGNALNNASYKRTTLGAGFSMTPVGEMFETFPAIYAWRDHGGGADTPDPSVQIVATDVPNEGRFQMAAKVTDLGGGQWRYDYAVRNLNSHRSAGSFIVPIDAAMSVTNVGFHDVDYHSGDPYDNTDWAWAVTGDAVVWSSPQTFQENPNTNALRWATMYNFWFDADAPPGPGQVTIRLFMPGDPETVRASITVPGGGDCPADVNGDQVVDVQDLTAVVLAWGPCPGGCAADVTGDETVNVEDLSALILAWGDCPAP